MKMILIVIWLVGPSKYVEMQEFESKRTCEAAAHHVYQFANVFSAKCLEK